MSRPWKLAVAFTAFALVAALALPTLAQDQRPASPRGEAATQVAGHWAKQENGRTRYEGGKWVTVDYGRPILRGRTDIFGSGADYGKGVDAGAPVWRAGANQTTRLSTEAALTINGKRLDPGEYSLFVELSEGKWTLIVSTQPYQKEFSRDEKTATWGSYGYDSKFDVVRAPMSVGETEHSIDQFTIAFLDVTDSGGTLAMAWENTLATVPFQLAEP
jgi:hypothetical protein